MHTVKHNLGVFKRNWLYPAAKAYVTWSRPAPSVIADAHKKILNIQCVRLRLQHCWLGGDRELMLAGGHNSVWTAGVQTTTTNSNETHHRNVMVALISTV